jgi:hypothetical protein
LTGVASPGGLIARFDGAHNWLQQRSSRAVVFSAVLGLVLCIAITLAVGWPPAPFVHDEFSYLLGADTFAHGRVTNPTHPLWEHFETFHVIHKPSYASKYPPGQALLLALGQVLTGAPIVGVWIGYAIFCAAITWMLQAWTRPRWALWGGAVTAFLLAGLHVNAGYWTTTYWGGAIAAAGGALLFGGVRRLTRSGGESLVGPAVAVGVGLAVLANTRPFEGLLAAIPALVFLVALATRSIRRRQPLAWIGASFAVLGPVALLMAYYNFRVTGRATEFPYVQHERQYSSAAVLRGQTPPPLPVYRHAVIACLWTSGAGHVAPLPTARIYLTDLRRRFRNLREGLAPVFVLPLLVILPWAIRREPPWLALASLVTVGIGFAFTPYLMMPHYAAPVLGAYVILLTRGARHLHALHMRKWRFGRTVLRVVQLCVFLSTILSIVAYGWTRNARSQRWQWQRSRIVKELSTSGQQHLVVVTYGANHNPDAEWVYNAADIDGSPVVWARSMGNEKDEQLVKYFGERRVWSLHVGNDNGPFRLESFDFAARNRNFADSVPVAEKDEFSCRQ